MTRVVPARIGELTYLRPAIRGAGASARAAYPAASARLRNSSLASTLGTWCSAVLRLMNNRSALSGFDRPRLSSSRTSDSRRVSGPARWVDCRTDAQLSQQPGCGVRLVSGLRNATRVAASASGAGPVTPRWSHPGGRRRQLYRPRALGECWFRPAAIIPVGQVTLPRWRA